MQILLANPRGFCAGVDRAIEIVERALELFGAPVYVRHEVVHNKYVVNSLRHKGAIFVGTCLAAAIACLVMGIFANWPIGLAPGMGLNAFFTYTVVGEMGYSWEIALGAVFIAGILFFLMSMLGKIEYQ